MNEYTIINLSPLCSWTRTSAASELSRERSVAKFTAYCNLVYKGSLSSKCIAIIKARTI